MKGRIMAEERHIRGASRHLMNICTIAGGFGTGYTLGDNRVGMDPETLRFSKLIILWGANTLSTNSHLWRSILTARRMEGHGKQRMR
jgi:anaerobic selenocysteine-containing dehydrogenase